MAEPTTPPGKTDIQALATWREFNDFALSKGYTEEQREIALSAWEAALALLRAEGEQPSTLATPGGGLPGDHNGELAAKHDALRKLAERTQAKNPGPWFVCHDANSDGTMDLETGRTGLSEWPPAQRCEQPEADYIAAVSPDVVIGLLDHIQMLQRSLVRDPWDFPYRKPTPPTGEQP